MTKEEEIVRSVFDSYIRDLKAISTKKDRPTFDMLEEVKNKAIKALEQPTSEDCVSRQAVDRLCFEYLKPNTDDNIAFYEHFCDLPPVIPTLPKDITNGDMIKAMFPKIEIYTDVINEIVDVEICEDSSELRCSIDWWNTPYKGVKNEQRNDR